jgi:hypothetical protein
VVRRATSALFLSFNFIRYRQKDFPEARVMRHHRQLACAMMDIREEGLAFVFAVGRYISRSCSTTLGLAGRFERTGEMTFVSKEMRPR